MKIVKFLFRIALLILLAAAICGLGLFLYYRHQYLSFTSPLTMALYSAVTFFTPGTPQL